MKVEQSELASKIEKLKSVVSKSSGIPAWNGILFRDGELIASNHELTVKAKLDGAAGESFILPAKVFDLIKNLPDGQMSITADDKDLFTIRAGKVTHSFQGFPAEQFPLPSAWDACAGGSVGIPADALKKSGKACAVCCFKNPYSCGHAVCPFRGKRGGVKHGRHRRPYARLGTDRF